MTRTTIPSTGYYIVLKKVFKKIYNISFFPSLDDLVGWIPRICPKKVIGPQKPDALLPCFPIMSEVNETQAGRPVEASSRYPPGLFGNTPLGYVKDGKWHVTVPSNFPQGGFKDWSRCAFMTVTPDRRYVPAVCKDKNVGPGDTFVIDYPKVPKEGTVKVVRVVMPVLPDWQVSYFML